MTREEPHKGFAMSWQDPPIDGRWQASIAMNDHPLYERLCRYRGGEQGAQVMEGGTPEEMLANAKAYIDKLVG